MAQLTLIERAFEVARSGRVVTVQELERVLSKEGYSGVPASLAGKSIRTQLKGLITIARTPAG